MSEARGLWIDERQRELGGPWRKVHSDFQMDVPVARVGEGFDPGEFVETLQRAHVDSITVHAKNTYGYLFFPSATGPVHPDLAEPDLLGKQVAACRAAGIKVYAYLAYGWDEWLAERRPDLLAVKRDRTSFLPPVGEQPMWSALCISQPEVRERSLRHVDEVLDHCEPDGIWFDMVYPIRCECYCHRCLSELRAAGLDPLDIEVQRRHKNELHTTSCGRSPPMSRAAGQTLRSTSTPRRRSASGSGSSRSATSTSRLCRPVVGATGTSRSTPATPAVSEPPCSG